jgi:hypothetical protein
VLFFETLCSRSFQLIFAYSEFWDPVEKYFSKAPSLGENKKICSAPGKLPLLYLYYRFFLASKAMENRLEGVKSKLQTRKRSKGRFQMLEGNEKNPPSLPKVFSLSDIPTFFSFHLKIFWRKILGGFGIIRIFKKIKF